MAMPTSIQRISCSKSIVQVYERTGSCSTSKFLRPEHASSLFLKAKFSQQSRAAGRQSLRVVAGPQPETEEGSALDFPQEWLKPGPSRRPDIFPEFEPIKPPLPQPMPGDPEEPEEEEEEEGEENPEEEPPPEE
ncbi:hypothetical protein CYMTET_24129 [Cymbomonas tetramitiformis]|uniref:Uncharacterized protein n=1 Tax=Cymbomonas tetramitiformis TaxID=36881 RepID=A0AAE0L0K6_9CHLO|nr:hypothetical protein CYMTET_24129 [Cymbomonas tetramitiformis]